MFELDFDDVTFYNFNIEEVEKILNKREEDITKGMPDLVKRGYLIGVDTALSFMKQLLEQGEIDNHIQFYKSGPFKKEFCIGERVEWIDRR